MVYEKATPFLLGYFKKWVWFWRNLYIW